MQRVFPGLLDRLRSEIHVQQVRSLVTGASWCVDHVALTNEGLRVAGWALTPGIPAERLAISVNGIKLPHFTHSIRRSDISDRFWHEGTAELSGFNAESTDVSGLRSARDLTIRLVDPVESGPLNPEDEYVFLCDETRSLPSPERMRRVHGSDADFAFRLHGYTAYKKISRLLERVAGKCYADFAAVLDWGCGCGRLARFLEADTSVTGVDIDADNVQWCQQHLSGRFLTIPLRPPSALASDQFDLIIGISVFTHLREDVQFEWLAELQRLARPCALLLMSVHGNAAVHREPSWDATVFKVWRERGFVDGPSHDLGDSIAERGYYRNSYHTADYIQRRWSPYFEIVEILPAYIGGMQDLVVLRKQ